MQILTDRILKEAGLDFAVARALLRPAEGELTVHVVQVLDAGPAECLHDSSACLDNHLHEDDSEHGGQDVRLTAEGEVALGQPLPTIEPPSASPRGARSCTGRAAETSAAAAGGGVDVDCRGWNFTQAAELGERYHLTLTQIGGVYSLNSPVFGLAHFMSLSSAVAALRQYGRMCDQLAAEAAALRPDNPNPHWRPRL